MLCNSPRPRESLHSATQGLRATLWNHGVIAHRHRGGPTLPIHPCSLIGALPLAWVALTILSVGHPSAADAADAAQAPLTRICVTEPAEYYADTEDVVRRRMDVYESLGVEMLRVQTGWEQGALIPELLDRDFRIKLILYVLGLPPEYAALHMDEAMIDSAGVADWHYGPWHSEARERTRAAAEVQMQRLAESGILGKIDEVCADLGPAAEGIYPANWTLSREGEEAFWCYSPAAQADFRESMRLRYLDITQANDAWALTDDTRFENWADVEIPPPGTAWARGPLWNDMLTWYRDSKRRFMLERIDDTIEITRRYLGEGARVIVYLPGWAYSQEEWDAAVATAGGASSIRLMMDNDWLMDAALERGCMLQYTGVENATEVRRIVRKLRDRGSDAYSMMWGENAGYEVFGRDPIWLARVITTFGLRGVDLTWGNWLLEADHYTPSPTCEPFRRAVAAIHRYADTGEPVGPDALPQTRPTEVALGVCSVECAGDTRLLNLFPEHVKGWDTEIAVVEGPQRQRILLKFALDGLPQGRAIREATLHMTGHTDYQDEEQVEVGVYRITEPWDELAATWMERNLLVPWSSPGGDAVGRDGLAEGEPYAQTTIARLQPGDTVEWELTDLVREWRSGQVPNLGLMLALPTGVSANKSLTSREHPDPERRPVLVVTLE